MPRGCSASVRRLTALIHAHALPWHALYGYLRGLTRWSLWVDPGAESTALIVSSFLHVEVEPYLCALAKAPAGSRLIEAFLGCAAHKGKAEKGAKKEKAGEAEKNTAAAVSRLQKWIKKWTVPCAAAKPSPQAAEDPSLAEKLGQAKDFGALAAAASEGDEQPKKKARRGRNRDADPTSEDAAAQAPDDAEGAAAGAGGVAPIVALAMDKFGSRVVEALYLGAAVSGKRAIVEALGTAEKELQADFHGRITLSKCRVSTFTASGGKDEWEAKEVGNEKKRAMFADILAGVRASDSQPPLPGEIRGISVSVWRIYLTGRGRFGGRRRGNCSR